MASLQKRLEAIELAIDIVNKRDLDNAIDAFMGWFTTALSQDEQEVSWRIWHEQCSPRPFSTEVWDLKLCGGRFELTDADRALYAGVEARAPPELIKNLYEAAQRAYPDYQL